MHTATKIRSSFEDSIVRFHASPALQALAGGRVTLGHYKAILREIYHYSKEDPQIQALAAVYFRGDDRDSVKMFLKHAISEIGHDRMALADLAALGEDVSEVPLTNPLPTTIALTAFPFYQVQYANPIGYLGYLYFLEHMPTAAGRTGMLVAPPGLEPGTCRLSVGTLAGRLIRPLLYPLSYGAI
jgi:hypothetical protein